MSNCDDQVRALEKQVLELGEALAHLRRSLANPSMASDSIDPEMSPSSVSTSRTSETIQGIASKASHPSRETSSRVSEITGSAKRYAVREMTVTATRVTTAHGHEIEGGPSNQEQSS